MTTIYFSWKVHYFIFFLFWYLIIAWNISRIARQNILSTLSHAWDITRLVFYWLWFFINGRDVLEVLFWFMLDGRRGVETEQLLHLFALDLLLLDHSWHWWSFSRCYITLYWNFVFWAWVWHQFLVFFSWRRIYIGSKPSWFNNRLLGYAFLRLIYFWLDYFFIFDLYNRNFFGLRRRHWGFRSKLNVRLNLNTFLFFWWRDVLNLCRRLLFRNLRSVLFVVLQVWSLCLRWLLILLNFFNFLRNFLIFFFFFDLIRFALDFGIAWALLNIFFVGLIDHSLKIGHKLAFAFFFWYILF